MHSALIRMITVYYIVEIEIHEVIICTFASEVTGLGRFVKTVIINCMLHVCVIRKIFPNVVCLIH